MRKPKRITQATLVGERGISLIAQIAMSMGLVWYPTGSVEAGIDGHLELRDSETGEVFNAVIGVQSKATDRAFVNETETGLDFYCDERDIDYWLNGNLPVVLIVSRPSTSEAYWVSVKDYFRDPGRRASKKVHFHKGTDRFGAGCRDALFRLAVPQDVGLYLAPPLRNEVLISNLLPVELLTSRMYVAPTKGSSKNKFPT